ncbi:MAG: N-methyl-L-tryptophan oxidase [Chloroflexi bacterium]|nr:N-methyl-L-tryptophan oxidase [Chloroflexota bacterium]
MHAVNGPATGGLADGGCYDVIVVGVGGMGSATVYELARRGRRVLGLERHEIPHVLGSSHGYSRVIRLAYFEDPAYVPLLRRAYELWRELEEVSGDSLLRITGSIDAGPRGDRIFEGSREACAVHGLEHEVLSSRELSERFPAYRLSAETMAVLQPQGGFLDPERCIVAYVAAARSLGAAVRTGEALAGWEVDGSGVRVVTEIGEYRAERLVITAGAWAGKIVEPLAGSLRPERQVLGWFTPSRPEWFRPSHFPVFNMTVPEGHFYGLPVYPEASEVSGFKIGRYHHLEETCDPDTVDRTPRAADEAVLRSFVERYFPAGAGKTVALQTCLFTNTPDEHFILDRHPDHPAVAVAAGFSGHGFKFASVVGEIMADLATAGATAHAIDMFRCGRFGEG